MWTHGLSQRQPQQHQQGVSDQCWLKLKLASVTTRLVQLVKTTFSQQGRLLLVGLASAGKVNLSWRGWLLLVGLASTNEVSLG